MRQLQLEIPFKNQVKLTEKDRGQHHVDVGASNSKKHDVVLTPDIDVVEPIVMDARAAVVGLQLFVYEVKARD